MHLVVLVKVDGERDQLPWTVVVTGRQLTQDAIRRDGPTLEACLAAALMELVLCLANSFTFV